MHIMTGSFEKHFMTDATFYDKEIE